MPVSLPGVPFQARSNVPDLVGAISRGFTAGFQPRKQSEELLQSMLANKIQGAKAKLAPQMEQANLNHLLAQTQGLGDEHSLRGLRQQLLQQQVNQALYEQQLNQSLFGGGAQSTNVNPWQVQTDSSSFVPSLKDNISNGMSLPQLPQTSDQQSNIVNPGNASMYHLDELYNSDPRARQALEKRGFKQTQTTKYDPKTGMTTVLTTSPSGKVTLTSTGGTLGQGGIPLTNAVKTQQQNIITNVPKAVRLIDSIISKPSPIELPGYRKGARKAHDALVKEAAETYAKAKGWPNTISSIHDAEQILGRGMMESDSDYRERLVELQNELNRNVEDANNTLYPNKKGSQSNSGVIEYVRVNGRLVPKQ